MDSNKPTGLNEVYLRAAYADYPSCEVKNNFATMCRMFSYHYSQQTTSSQSQYSAKDLLGLFSKSVGIETIFFLPNYFRWTLLTHSSNISFANTTDALLDLMNYMFRLQNKGHIISEFKVTYFLTSYRNFWTTRLPYESLSFCTRFALFDKTKDWAGYAPAGVISGMAG